MEFLAQSEQAFIRPSASGETLGGVAAKTRQSMLLCEAAGYDVVLIETVGVGQSEVLVHDMVDVFLLLLLPGAGDELQGIKKGIVEMADIIAVNKADGEQKKEAKQALVQYRQAMQLLHGGRQNWQTKLHTCSSTTTDGLDGIWSDVEAFYHNRQLRIAAERKQQEVKAFKQQFTDYLLNWAQNKAGHRIENLLNQIHAGEIASVEAYAQFIAEWDKGEW
jgi:LAO/AO transport system kinase